MNNTHQDPDNRLAPPQPPHYMNLLHRMALGCHIAGVVFSFLLHHNLSTQTMSSSHLDDPDSHGWQARGNWAKKLPCRQEIVQTVHLQLIGGTNEFMSLTAAVWQPASWRDLNTRLCLLGRWKAWMPVEKGDILTVRPHPGDAWETRLSTISHLSRPVTREPAERRKPESLEAPAVQ